MDRAKPYDIPKREVWDEVDPDRETAGAAS